MMPRITWIRPGGGLTAARSDGEAACSKYGPVDARCPVCPGPEPEADPFRKREGDLELP